MAISPDQNLDRDYVQGAGLGKMIWGSRSYLAAHYYHYIVAIFVGLIWGLTLSQHTDAVTTVLVLAGYFAYVAFRKALPQKDLPWFYQPNVQFWRAQLGLAAILLLYFLRPSLAQTTIWLAMLLIILLMSRHCATLFVLTIAVESCAVLWLAYGFAAGHWSVAALADPDLIVHFLWIGLFTFILLFLVRNIQARDETIAAHTAIGALTREASTANTTRQSQWQPILDTLRTRLNAEYASIWMPDLNSDRLVRAGFCQNPLTPLAEISVSILDGKPRTVIQAAAREARQILRIAFPQSKDGGEALAFCPDYAPVHAELALPIQARTRGAIRTVGVLSVGFLEGQFRERLLGDYADYMEGVIGQARPMLAYSWRVNELEQLQSTLQHLWTSLEPELVMQTALEWVIRVLRFEFAVVSLVDPEARTIEAIKGVNVNKRWLALAKYALDSNDIHADIVRTGATEAILGQDPRLDPRIWDRHDHAAMVCLFAPIRITDARVPGGRVIGTIEAGYRNRARLEIGTDQVRMVQSLTGVLGMAIQHAQLLQRVQTKAAALANLHSASQTILSTRKLIPILHQIASHALDLLHADSVVIYRYDADNRRLDEPVIAGTLKREASYRLGLTEDALWGRLLNDLHPLYSADARYDPMLSPHLEDAGDSAASRVNFARWHRIASVACLPLTGKDRVPEIVGFMFVNYRRRQRFSQDERQIHELFAQLAAVAIRNAEMNELANHLAIREERIHLSRELHHSVSQALFAMTLKAQNARETWALNPSGALAELSDIQSISHIASQEIGAIIDELRMPIEDDLERTVTSFLQRIQTWHKFDIVQSLAVPPGIATPQARGIYQLIREAVNNAVKYARCTRLQVSIQTQDGCLRLTIEDDGVGFDPTRIRPGAWGLRNMEELARQIGGDFRLDTTPGLGTTIAVTVPLTFEEMP